MSTAGRKDLFAEETQLLQQAKLTLARFDMPAEEWQREYKHMVEEYDKLLSEARTLTRIADRNQRR